jgi:hypothetical protein
MTSPSLTALLAGKAQREEQYFQAAAAAAETWFDEQGNWVLNHTPLANRERLWVCFALYAGTEVQCRRADAVVLGTEVQEYEGRRFDIFASNIAPILYLQHQARMSHEARHALLDLTAEGHGDFPGDRQADFQFHGYNDNMPAKGTMSLILGGEILKSQVALAHGNFQLRQLQEQLYRNGLTAEYNSPTYSALTLHALAEIAEFSTVEHDREIARALERRLWADLACHWHPTSHQQAGPHSRAYTADSVGLFTCVRSVVWAVLGEAASGLSPLALFDPPKNLMYHHCGNIPFNIAQMCWFVAGHYHLDEDLAALFLDKPCPFTLTATAECGDAREMPSRQTVCTTYMTPAYSLGTSSTGWLDNSQPSAFFVTFPRDGQEPVGSTVDLRYTSNEEVPGLLADDGEWRGEADLVHNRAHYVTLQDGPSALVSCHPAGALAEMEVSRLSLMTIFAEHLGEVEEVRVGERAYASWEGEFGPRQWFGVRAGRCLLALRPLAYSAVGLEARVRLESYPRYKAITIDNYRGEPRQFPAADLLHIFNGFAAEVASVDEFPSLGDFLAALQEASFEDYAMFHTRRLRYFRPELPGRPAVELATSYTVRDCSPRYRTINGREFAGPPWQATGLPEESVSVMPTGWHPRKAGIPWDSLEVYWYPGNPWGINEKGR